MDKKGLILVEGNGAGGMEQNGVKSMQANGLRGRLGLTVSEVATELGVSDNTVRRWADAGHIRTYRTPGGQRRFSVEAMDDFMRRAEGAAAAS